MKPETARAQFLKKSGSCSIFFIILLSLSILPIARARGGPQLQNTQQITPEIRYHSYDINDDTGGDGDGLPEPGETIEMTINLQNISPTLDFSGVTATFSADMVYIENIFSENFERYWPGDWVVEDLEVLGGLDFWGKSNNRLHSGSWSAYCAEESDVSSQEYDNFMYARMYRTIDLSSYDLAELSYYYWLDSENNYDYLKVGYFDSSDSSWHWIESYTGLHTDWVYDSIMVPNTVTSVGFMFYSDPSITSEGAYLDDITLNAYSYDSYLNVIDDYDEFGDMPAGSMASSLGNYVFEIASDCPEGSIIRFDLDISADNGGPWSDRFEITIWGEHDLLLIVDDDAEHSILGTSKEEFKRIISNYGFDYTVLIESIHGRPTLKLLKAFNQVIWTCGDNDNGAVDSEDSATLNSYVTEGGLLLLEGEDIGSDHGSDDFMVNVAHALHQIDDTGAEGLTVTNLDHPVTQGLPTTFNWFLDPLDADGVNPTNGGIEVIEYAGTDYTAVTVYEGSSDGSVVYYSFPLYCLHDSEAERLVVNTLNWLKHTRTGDRVWSKTSNPSGGADFARGVAVDGTGVYIVGGDYKPGNDRWRMEKRSLTDGSLLWKKTANPSSGWDTAVGVAVDGSGVYVVGWDDQPGNWRWRIEKRSTTDGSVIWLKTSNPSSDWDEARGVAVDGTGVYTVGSDYQPGNARWRIEKRSLEDGDLIWKKTSNPSSGYDQALSVAVDGTSVYIVGYDQRPGSGNTRWRIEKRSITDGSLIWKKTGNPSSGQDRAHGVAVDGTGVYVAGYDSRSGNSRWRIEKRSLTDGSLIWTKTSNPSIGDDIARGLTVDGTGVFIMGSDKRPGNWRWRIEKRDLSTGSILWTKTINPSSGDDEARGIAVDDTGIYMVGYDFGPGNWRWRIEKRHH